MYGCRRSIPKREVGRCLSTLSKLVFLPSLAGHSCKMPYLFVLHPSSLVRVVYGKFYLIDVYMPLFRISYDRCIGRFLFDTCLLYPCAFLMIIYN